MKTLMVFSTRHKLSVKLIDLTCCWLTTTRQQRGKKIGLNFTFLSFFMNKKE